MFWNNSLYYSNNNIPTQVALQSIVTSIQNTVNNLQNNSYTSSNKPYVVGIYQGDGASSRTIPLGFTPICVLVVSQGVMISNSGGIGNIYHGGLAVTNSNAATLGDEYTVLSIISNGFRCYYDSSKSLVANYDGRYYNYIAFK